MRKLAPLALLMLAGLAAVTFAPSASAMCAVDAEGGCSPARFDLQVAVQPCADDAARLCIAGDEDADTLGVHTGVLNLTVRNGAGSDVDFEIFVTQRLDDAVADDGSAARVRADRIAAFAVPAGQSVTREVQVDDNASALRLQALAADGREAERDAQVWQVMYMAGGAPQGDGSGEAAHPADPAAEDLADDSGPAAAEGKDAPYLGIVAIVGALAAIVGLRRVD